MRTPSLRDVSALVILGVVLALQPLGAQEVPQSRLGTDQWLDWERAGEVRVSPDGSRVVYERRWVDRLNDRWEEALWIVGSDGSRNRHLVDGSSPRWSPDGTRIAFLAEDDRERTQVFVRWMDGEGATTQVTRVDETPSNLAWSPDGTRISMTLRVPPERAPADHWRISLPRPEGADWTDDPRIVETLEYRNDRRGFVDERYEHVFVVPAQGGTPRQVTSGDYDHGSPAWMPDGESILVDGLRVEDAAYRWKEREIYAVDVASGTVRQLTQRRGPDENPVPSPDGRLIAYVGHDTTSMDYIEDILYVMEADGSNPRALTPELDRSPEEIFWAPDGEGVYFDLAADGHQNLHYASLTGEVRPVTEGAHMLDVSAVTQDGTAVGTLEAPRDPGDVVVFPLDRPSSIRTLTDLNGDVLAGKELGEVEEISYPSFDGTPVQGWIITPPGFDPSGEYPLILVIHGGPHAMYDVGFNFSWQTHAAHGYVVLYTNPRGSSGYGSEFGNAIQYAYPGDDYRDLMTGVDSVLDRGYVDESNMFVYGCSGGGVLTAWVVGHTDRFRAASSNCPVIDWVSFVGNVDGNYLRWYDDFERFPWEDASEHRRRSPLTYVGNVTTPTMLMTGVLDMRTPISQTEQFYQALKAQKKPTAMIRFNGEWHGTSSRPSNFIRTQKYLRAWFERWGDHDDRRATDDGGGA